MDNKYMDELMQMAHDEIVARFGKVFWDENYDEFEFENDLVKGEGWVDENCINGMGYRYLDKLDGGLYDGKTRK